MPRNRSGHSGPTVYIYTEPELDHSWLHGCKAFRELLSSSEVGNLAEVGIRHALASSVLRVRNPADASLFFVPIFEYASQKVNDTCRGADGNASSHRQRVALAAAKLSASPWWQRYRGADHAFATSAYSYGGRGAGTANLRQRLGGLLPLLRRGASGRYKPGPTATSVGRCVVGVPWHSVKLAAAGLQVPAGVSGSGAPLPWPRGADGVGGDGANGEVGGGGGPRRLLLHFAGSLDVVGMHANVRCAVGPLAAAAVGVADVAVRLTLHANASRWGNCARRAMALLAAARNGAEGGRGGEGGGGSGGGESAPAVTATGEGRSPGESFVRQTLREMSEATFCLMPAGDNSARSIMYTALALGCIPVVLCDPLADWLLPYATHVPWTQLWVKPSAASFVRNPASLLPLLRIISADDVRRKQAAIARHRADVLYDAPHSCAGTNFVIDAARCLSSCSFTSHSCSHTGRASNATRPTS